MNSLNSVLIEGNMVRDPLLRSTPKGTSVCNFSIAANRYYRQNSDFEKEVGFFEVEAWGKLAEACTNQGRKGRGVRVVGRLKQYRWTGNDGKNHTKVAIVAEHVEYRAIFNKKEEPPSEDEDLAETALTGEALEVTGGPRDFSGPEEESEDEELQMAVF